MTVDRHRTALVTALLALAASAWPTQARAGAGFVPSQSTMELALAGLPRVELTARPGSEAVVSLFGTPGQHTLVMSRTVAVWSTQDHAFGTALFTGVPLLSNLSLDDLFISTGGAFDGFTTTNPLGGGGPVGPTLGGYTVISGWLVLHAMGGAVQERVHLYSADQGAGTLLGNDITVSGGLPFVTTPIQLTGFTSNIVTIPARGNVQGVPFTLNPTSAETVMTLSTNGGFVSISGGLPVEEHTALVSGTNNLISGDQGGSVTVVAPLRIQTNAIAGSLPGQMRMHFVFVPEPSATVLLIAGVGGLLVLARRRQSPLPRD